MRAPTLLRRHAAEWAFIGAVSLAVAILLTGCGGGGGGGSGGGFAVTGIPVSASPTPAQQQAPTRDCSVALYGDSILNGSTLSGSKLAETPAAGLQRMRPAWRVVDLSVPGATATGSLQIVANAGRSTHVVVLEYGINDAGQGTDYEPALRTMVQHMKAVGSTPVVTGLSRVIAGVDQRDAYDAIARRVATDESVTFADWGAVRFDPADMADDVHHAQPYSTRLTEQLAHALDRVAPECAD